MRGANLDDTEWSTPAGLRCDVSIRLKLALDGPDCWNATCHNESGEWGESVGPQELVTTPRIAMDRQFPQEFIVRREVHAIQHFGQSLLEPIPAGEVILAECPSHYARMIEVVWHQKRYLVFDRDLTERAEPLRKSTEEDPLQSMFAS